MKKYFIGETLSLSEFFVAALLLVLLGSAGCQRQERPKLVLRAACGHHWAGSVWRSSEKPNKTVGVPIGSVAPVQIKNNLS